MIRNTATARRLLIQKLMTDDLAAFFVVLRAVCRSPRCWPVWAGFDCVLANLVVIVVVLVLVVDLDRPQSSLLSLSIRFVGRDVDVGIIALASFDNLLGNVWLVTPVRCLLVIWCWDISRTLYATCLASLTLEVLTAAIIHLAGALLGVGMATFELIANLTYGARVLPNGWLITMTFAKLLLRRLNATRLWCVVLARLIVLVIDRKLLHRLDLILANLLDYWISSPFWQLFYPLLRLSRLTPDFLVNIVDGVSFVCVFRGYMLRATADALTV